jgi:hypothetical protein
MGSTNGEIEYVKQEVLHVFDEWNDVTGWPDKFSGYYHEIKSIIEDAVVMAFNVANDEPIKTGLENDPTTATDTDITS